MAELHELIPVFAPEREAGLETAVAGGGRLVMAGLALPDVDAGAPQRAAALSLARGTNLGQADLYYLKSILVSTGLNRNDDYFERQETWAARKTPEDKPFNMRHKQDDIIGHMTACVAVGADGLVVPDDAAATSLPDKYHLLTTAVIYKYCDVPARQERIDKTLAELAEGKWYVSMECLFKGFDYVLVPKDASTGGYDLAQAKLVARSDQTAFLTKHLRAYGGSGVWNGHQVGRVLRNILFSGKGLVEKPANPESLIFTMDDEPLSGAAGIICELPTESGYGTDSTTDNQESYQMNELETLKAQVADLTSKLTAAQATVAEAKDKNWEKQVADIKAELAAAVAEATKAGEAGKETAQKLADAVKATAEAKAAHEAAEKAKAAAEAKLAEIEAAKKYADRLVAVKAAYEVDTDEEAKTLLDTSLLDLADDKFAKAIDAQTSYLAKKKAAYAATVKVGESKTTGLPAPMGGGSKKVATKAALAAATPVADPALAVTGADDGEAEATRADMVAWFDNAPKPADAAK